MAAKLHYMLVLSISCISFAPLHHFIILNNPTLLPPVTIGGGGQVGRVPAYHKVVPPNNHCKHI